jgi:hypothetical protein
LAREAKTFPDTGKTKDIIYKIVCHGFKVFVQENARGGAGEEQGRPILRTGQLAPVHGLPPAPAAMT